MPKFELPAGWFRHLIVFVHRIVIRLSRPEPDQRLLLGILIAYWAAWSLYGVIAKSSQGIHSDMGEVAAWSSDLQWGTPKHPPFLPALVRVWFSIFPYADWAYYLLAIGLVVVAIYFSWLMSGYWLSGTKRAAEKQWMTFKLFNIFLPITSILYFGIVFRKFTSQGLDPMFIYKRGNVSIIFPSLSFYSK